MININVNTITPLAGTSGTVSISGSLFVTGSITAEGNINLGDNENDSIKFVADVSSSILPDQTITYDLGSTSKKWRNLHVKAISASGNISASGTLLGSQATITGNISGSFISASNDLYVGGNTSVAGNATITGNISGSFISASNDLYVAGNTSVIGNISSSGNIQADGNITTGEQGSPAGNIHAYGNLIATGNITGSFISASNDLYVGGGIFVANTVSGPTDAAFHSVNGHRVEIKTQLQGALADGTFAAFELRNTSIAANSIVLGSMTGNTGVFAHAGGLSGNITGSIITAATTALYTASIQIHNETGGEIPNDTGFTASFIVL